MGRQYEFRVTGPVDDTVRDQLGPLHEVGEEPSTVLVGDVADQAEIHGLLVRLQNLGLHVVSVTPLPRRS